MLKQKGSETGEVSQIQVKFQKSSGPSGAKTKRSNLFSMRERKKVKVGSPKKLECGSLPLFLLVCRTPSTQEGLRSQWIDRMVNKCRVANFVSRYLPRQFARRCFGSRVGSRSSMRSCWRGSEKWRYTSTTIPRMRRSPALGDGKSSRQSPLVFYLCLHASWYSMYFAGPYLCYCGLLVVTKAHSNRVHD